MQTHRQKIRSGDTMFDPISNRVTTEIDAKSVQKQYVFNQIVSTTRELARLAGALTAHAPGSGCGCAPLFYPQNGPARQSLNSETNKQTNKTFFFGTHTPHGQLRATGAPRANDKRWSPTQQSKGEGSWLSRNSSGQPQRSHPGTGSSRADSFFHVFGGLFFHICFGRCLIDF